jgi:hypothetical protein
MTEDTDQLTETFAAHEHLAPDAALVLARASGIARSLHRRRLAARATGASVLGVGLVAGGIALPGRLGASSNQTVNSAQPAAGGDPTSTASPASYTRAQQLNAYFAAGYDYTDAQQLAQLWNDGGNIDRVKADAGLKLLEGQTLPIKPSGTPETPEDQNVAAFFAAGYDYNDAVSLAKLWHESDTYQVKGEAGQKLRAGETLPIQPSGSGTSTGSQAVTPPTGLGLSGTAAKKQMLILARNAKKGALAAGAGAPVVESPALAAYFAAGYDYDNAVTLQGLWHQTDKDIAAVKAEAGQKLLDGVTLPIQPSGTPESATEKAQDAYFNAGYDYNDAIRLGKLWHQSDLTQVKTEAGHKLLDGATLPISP